MRYPPRSLTWPLKDDGWKTILSFWGPGLCSGAFAVSFREGISNNTLMPGQSNS